MPWRVLGRLWLRQPNLQLARQEARPMVKGVAGAGKLDRFAPTPWTEESEGWLALDQHLHEDHLARRVADAVDMFFLVTRLCLVMHCPAGSAWAVQYLSLKAPRLYP